MKTFFSNFVKCVKCCCNEDNEDKDASELSDATASQINKNDSTDIELGLNQASNDMSVDVNEHVDGDIEDELNNKESQISKSKEENTSAWKDNVMSFLLNIRTIFDELQHQDDNCKYKV